MSNENTKMPPDLENILKKASEELLTKQNDGYCFTVDHDDQANIQSEHVTSYDKNELAEFINFDMLGEEGENLESFNNLITPTNHEDLTGDRKVLKIVLDPGVGQVVPENYVVFVHYIGYVSNILEPFDVTYLQGRRPKRFTLGDSELIPGLEIGIKSMRMGENARFIIKPELAFRELGCPPRIPPNATILFDVHLVTYLSPENSLMFDKDNRDPDKFQRILTKVKKLHFEGNELYKSTFIDKAISKYDKAKELLHLTGCNNDDEEIEMMKYLNKLYTNLSVCHLKVCSFNKVCRMGIEALKYSERFSKNSVKLFFNWGKALRLLKSFSEANVKLQKALKLEPHNAIIHDEIRKLAYDKEFNRNVELLSFDNENDDEENQFWPPEFWEVFDSHLKKFIDSDDDVLTVKLNDNSKNTELIKRKANVHDLEWQVIKDNGTLSNCIALKKAIN